MRTFPDKDPSAVLDYVFDWTEWLGSDTIDTYDLIVPDGLTKDSDSKSGNKVTVWISGGEANKVYVVTCRIVTAAGRTDEKSAKLPVSEN